MQLAVVDELSVVTGRYDRLDPSKAGTAFQFVMKDADGLPVVSETYDFRRRVSDFRVELLRVGYDTPPMPLPLEFIGNRELTADGSYQALFGQQRAERSMDGRVEVVIELEYTGPHHVQLRGPEGDETFQLMTWALDIFGVCSETEVIENATRKCICKVGHSRIASAHGGYAPCNVCEAGLVKDAIGDQACDTCTALNLQRFGYSDPNRRETRGTTMADHDTLADCGCSTNYYMNFAALSPALITERCPVLTRTDLWEQHANLSRYEDECCGGDGNGTSASVAALDSPLSSLCSGRAQWLCVERACREEYLAELVAVEQDPLQPGKCLACPPHQLQCNTTFFNTRTVVILPGYWRTNELSTNLRECYPREVCVGDQRDDPSRLTDSFCREAHWGPLCSVCLEGHFKNRQGLCISCSSLGDVVLKTYALTTLVLLCMGAFAYWRLRKTTARLIFRGEHAQERLRSMVRSVKALKVLGTSFFKGSKEVVSLVQLQVGVLPTFSISYPANFAALITALSELALPELPLACFTDVNYYSTLLWGTLIPPIVILILRFGRQFDAIFFFLFLIYPGVSSTIFAIFDCVHFDDGTRLLARDFSIDCDQPSHAWWRLYGLAMLLVYPVGIPLVYLEVIHRRNRLHLRIVQRVQRVLAADKTLLERGKLSEEREEAVRGAGVVSRSRMLAHKIFAQTHKHLGIELDTAHEFPVVSFVWPVYCCHTDEAGLVSCLPDEEAEC